MFPTRSLALVSVLAITAAVNGATINVQLYAELCSPMAFTFDPAGVIYVGNGGCGAGFTDPVWVRRIAVGGTPVEDYGQSQIPDPDAVLYDVDGVISGVAGAVLVGGRLTGVEGRISAILPDESIVTVFAGPPLFNPSVMRFDDTGRLVILEDSNPATVLISQGATPEVLFSIPNAMAPGGLAIDEENRIYTIAEDGVIQVHNPDGSLHNETFATGLGPGTVPLRFGPDGALYAVSAGELLRFDLDGSYEILAVGFGGTSDLQFGPDGDLYLARNEAIWHLTNCPADLDGDGDVGIGDFLILLAFWGTCDAVCLGDLDGDGFVGISDFLLLLASWGECP